MLELVYEACIRFTYNGGDDDDDDRPRLRNWMVEKEREIDESEGCRRFSRLKG